MTISFATCNRGTALKYIQKVYPSKNITDTEDCAAPLLDLVEKDIVRIQDPMMYGNKIGVVPANRNWDEKHRQEVISAVKLFS